MRGMLVVNPTATTTTESVRRVITQALSHQLDLDVVTTTHPGHGRDLGERARDQELDVVVTLGGDGTINECVNGMLSRGTGPQVPALATIPGGSGNVLARSIGFPKDPVDATAIILAGLVDRRFRTISLGLANERWFTMSVGMGLDAEIIAAMEEQRSVGRKASPSRYFATTLRQYFARTNRKDAPATILRPEAEPVNNVFVAIVQNAAPWTFFGDLAVNPSPSAHFDADLDLFAIQDLRVLPSLRWTRRLLMGSRAGSAKGLTVAHDVPELSLMAKQPTAVQLDGEALGNMTRVDVRSVRQALRLVV
jgi:diacylglycerol kinase family enzyme